MSGYVYLLHFNKPISDNHTCQHYTGWAEDLDRRLACHRSGNGARLTEVASDLGIDFELVRAWKGSRTDERRLKNAKCAPRFCPYCGGSREASWMEEISIEQETIQ